MKKGTVKFFNETKGEYSGVKDDLQVEWVHNSITGYQDMFPDVKFDWTTYMNNGFIVLSPKHKDLCNVITDFYYANEEELFLGANNAINHSRKKIFLTEKYIL